MLSAPTNQFRKGQFALFVSLANAENYWCKRQRKRKSLCKWGTPESQILQTGWRACVKMLHVLAKATWEVHGLNEIGRTWEEAGFSSLILGIATPTVYGVELSYHTTPPFETAPEYWPVFYLAWEILGNCGVGSGDSGVWEGEGIIASNAIDFIFRSSHFLPGSWFLWWTQDTFSHHLEVGNCMTAMSSILNGPSIGVMLMEASKGFAQLSSGIQGYVSWFN